MKHTVSLLFVPGICILAGKQSGKVLCCNFTLAHCRKNIILLLMENFHQPIFSFVLSRPEFPPLIWELSPFMLGGALPHRSVVSRKSDCGDPAFGWFFCSHRNIPVGKGTLRASEELEMLPNGQRSSQMGWFGSLFGGRETQGEN